MPRAGSGGRVWGMKGVILAVLHQHCSLLPNTHHWDLVKGDIIAHLSGHSCLLAWLFCPLSPLIYSSGSNW